MIEKKNNIKQNEFVSCVKFYFNYLLCSCLFLCLCSSLNLDRVLFSCSGFIKKMVYAPAVKFKIVDFTLDFDGFGAFIMPAALAAEPFSAPEFSMQEDAVCGDYIYRVISCSLIKKESKTDLLKLSISIKNTGPDSGPFPPLMLADKVSKKEIAPVEKLPAVKSGSSLMVNIEFIVEKKASYILKVSGDSEGYLNAYIALNAEVSDPKNQLLKAAADGDVEKIKELIKKGADVNSVNSKKETVLMLAAKSGNSEAVRILLKAKANYKKANLDDEHALYYAIESGDYDTVKVLLECGSDTYYTNYRGKTPLIAAKKEGDDKIIELVRKYSSRKD